MPPCRNEITVLLLPTLIAVDQHSFPYSTKQLYDALDTTALSDDEAEGRDYGKSFLSVGRDLDCSAILILVQKVQRRSLLRLV